MGKVELPTVEWDESPRVSKQSEMSLPNEKHVDV